MKKNLPVSGKELDYSDEQRIISLTDAKGVITYVNKDFCDIAGYSEDELIGRNHNIVRHPDMPSAAFQDLWATIKTGRPWIGIVKNRCKNGDHYWVNAYVTPVFEAGQVVGYQSVRTKPKREWVERADRLYKRLNGEKISFKLPTFSMRGKSVLVMLLITWLISGLAIYAGASVALMLGAALVGSLFSWLLGRYMTQTLETTAEVAQQVYSNGVAELVYGDAADEVGKIQLSMAAMQARGTTLVTRMDSVASDLTSLGQEATSIAETTRDDIERQQIKLDEVAVAIRQMSVSIGEVAGSAAQTAQACEESDEQALQGRLIVKQMSDSISTLVESINEATIEIRELHQSSSEIGKLVDVIRAVADQTNLLALNAAIEAARAGEHGRGFAVVADEVRTLAIRSQESTEEIENVISKMHLGVEKAVAVMERDQDQVKGTLLQAEQARLSLDSIVASAGTIAQMSTQIATATEEQTSVSGEIRDNFAAINEVAEATTQAAAANLQASRQLTETSQALLATVNQFK